MDVWKGDWGLPSVDRNCLQAMAYIKFSGAPVKLNKTNNPWRSPTGELPVYRQKPGRILTKFEEIHEHLRSQNYYADFELTQKQQSDIRAYDQLLQDKLLPGLLYTWWVDSKNYVDLTLPWFAKALPFPLNYFIPGQRQREAKNYIFRKYNLDDGDDLLVLEALVLKNGQECLNLLSDRFENNEFLFGKSPTSLDALVFAYLAPLLKVPFPNSALQNHLKGCDSLVKFVVRVLHRYFPSADEDRSDKKSSPSSDSIDEFPHKIRNQVLAGLTALVAMIGYAVTTGLVQVAISDDLESEDEGEEDDTAAVFQNFYGDEENDQHSEG